MKRVVITGMGIWSSIGQDLNTVMENLKNGCSGVFYDSQRIEYGLQSGLTGNVPRPDLKPFLSRRARQMMSSDSEYAYMAARQAFEQAEVSDDYRRQNNIGVILGNDGNSHICDYAKIMDETHSSSYITYNAGFRSVTSSSVINLSSIFHLRGINFIVGAGCSSAGYAIGMAMMFIRQGLENMILVGGSANPTKELVSCVDATMLSHNHNTSPEQASRPFDKDAGGVIFSGGAAMLVLEEYEHAIARGVPILAEIIGFGYARGGLEEVYLADWQSDYRAMSMAIEDANIKSSDIDFIHSRADSFPKSDQAEAIALQQLFCENKKPISSTDSIAGHESWMAGASRTIYSILMMHNNFIAPTLNLENPIEEAKGLNIVRSTTYIPLNTIMINAAGGGGTNCSIILKKIK